MVTNPSSKRVHRRSRKARQSTLVIIECMDSSRSVYPKSLQGSRLQHVSTTWQEIEDSIASDKRKTSYFL